MKISILATNSQKPEGLRSRTIRNKKIGGNQWQ